MTTVSHGIVVGKTTNRFRSTILTGTDAIADVADISIVKTTLKKGDSVVIEPKRLFAVSINGVKIVIRITVGQNTVEFPISSNLSIPFDGNTDVSVELENPSDNEVELPASITYVSV